MHDEKTSGLVKFIYREKALYLVGIYTSREEFIPRWNLCITRRIHASLKIMHHGKLFIASQKLCTTRRFHASSKFMHREKILYLVEILHIAIRFHASLKVMHREKIHISREFTYCGKIFMPRKRTYTDKEREIVYPKNSIYPSASTSSFFSFFLIKINIKKSIEDDDKRYINIASIFTFLFRRQV